jgi:hypothetical protein
MGIPALRKVASETEPNIQRSHNPRPCFPITMSPTVFLQLSDENGSTLLSARDGVTSVRQPHPLPSWGRK